MAFTIDKTSNLVITLVIAAVVMAAAMMWMNSAESATGCRSLPMKRMIGTLGDLGAGGAPPC